MDLTIRQRELLRAIIELHVKTGEPVGSENLDKVYSLGVSPATIRNEMARLTELGYLKQPHTSAGRIPTSIGYRLYIQELMKEKQLPVAAEVSIREALWQQRFKEDRLLREGTKALAHRCGMLAIAVDQEGNLYYAGAANVLDWPEFADIDVTRFVFSLFDENPTLQQILGKAVGTDPMHVLFGEEMEYENLNPVGFVFSRYYGLNEGSGIIGIVGPARMNFPMILPLVRYTCSEVSRALTAI